MYVCLALSQAITNQSLKRVSFGDLLVRNGSHILLDLSSMAHNGFCLGICHGSGLEPPGHLEFEGTSGHHTYLVNMEIWDHPGDGFCLIDQDMLYLCSLIIQGVREVAGGRANVCRPRPTALGLPQPVIEVLDYITTKIVVQDLNVSIYMFEHISFEHT